MVVVGGDRVCAGGVIDGDCGGDGGGTVGCGISVV